jgi:hypothetical protein
MYYAAIKWPVAEGPKPRDIANDLQILAMTLIAEHDWSFASIEAMMYDAIDAAQEQQMELTSEPKVD